MSTQSAPAKVNIDDLLAANRKQPPGPKCTVCRALAEADTDTRAKLQGALDDAGNFPAAGLAKVFTALGHQMGASPVERHRRSECMNRG